MSFVTEGNRWLKLSFLVMAVTLLLHMIAMGAPNWAKSNDDVLRREHIGLWQYCTDTIGGGRKCNAFVDIIVGDWLKAAQSFSIMALFVMLGAVAVLAMCAFIPTYNEGDDPRMHMIGIALTGVAALFKLIEVATVAATYQEYFKNKDPGVWGEVGQLSWAFGVAAASLFLNCATVVLLVIGMSGEDKY